MPILLAIFSAFILAGLALKPLSDPDLWWHLAVGRWILYHGEAPQQDYWNAFAVGSPWIAYSWLPEWLFARVEQSGSMAGLLVLKWLLAAAVLSTFIVCFCLLAKHWTIGLALSLAVGLSCLPFFGLRPQAISWICAAVVLFFAERICQRSRGPLHYALLTLSMVLWANSHITTVFGIVMAAVWVYGSSKAGTKAAPWVLVLCFIGSLCTPYTGREWLTLLSKSGHPFLHIYIREFQPATVFLYSTLLLFGLLTALFVMVKHYPKAPMPVPRIVLVLLFAVAGMVVQKFLPYAAILAGTAIASQTGRITRRKSLASAPLPGTKMLGAYSGVLALGLLIAVLQFRSYRTQPIDTALVPVEPAAFIELHELPWPVLNGFNDGGYMLLTQTSPQGQPYNLVPIDGRTNINPPETTRAFIEALHGRSGWTEFFDLVKPKTVLWENRFPLTEILEVIEDWCRVYPIDGKSNWSIFLRRDEYTKRQAALPSSNCTPAKTHTFERPAPSEEEQAESEAPDALSRPDPEPPKPTPAPFL